MRYLVFGDSIAFGATDYQNGGWQEHLRKYFEGKEQQRCFYNVGVSGDTSKKLLARIKAEAKARIRDKPRKEWTIFISVGVNDSRLENEKPKVTEKEFQDNLSEILKIAKELASKVVLIESVPVIEKKCNPWRGKECYFLNGRIKKYNEIMKKCAEKEDVKFIKLFSKIESRLDLHNLYDDGLHPNAKGHLEIYKEIKDNL